MNKKGFLLAEETLKIVIAVICILFLAGFLISIYLKNKTDNDLELAKASLEYLIEEINAKHSPVEIYNPKGWVISSWPYGAQKKLPKSCENLGWKSCICISKDVGLGKQVISLLPFTQSNLDYFIDNSDNNGFCLENSGNLIVNKGPSIQGPIVISSPFTLNIDYANNKITK